MADRPSKAPVTNTPIRYASMRKGQFGQFNPSNVINLLSLLPQLHKDVNTPEGEIVIDPSQVPGGESGIGKAVSHESVHALLNKLGYKALLAAQRTPGFHELSEGYSPLLNIPLLSNMTNASRGGFASEEVPADAAAYTSRFKGNAQQRNDFVRDFATQLTSYNPQVARMYQLIGKGK